MRRSVAVLVPCYKRPEYTKLCIESIMNAQRYWDEVEFFLIDDGSKDETYELLSKCPLNTVTISRASQVGLRNTILEFFSLVEHGNYDFLSKVDNDCLVPKNWLNDILEVFEKSDADILSPNVNPSNAAFKYGAEDKEGKGYRPAETVGGVWTMRASMIQGIDFERFRSDGIKGAWNIIKQITTEKEPVIGWLENVTFEDIGHWSGNHPLHIKSTDHEFYSMEIGRRIAWNSQS